MRFALKHAAPQVFCYARPLAPLRGALPSPKNGREFVGWTDYATLSIKRKRVGFGWPTLFTVHGKRRNYANSISDIEPPGGIIGMTASSFGITTSISTGPGVANASF